jgi:hypothetical protein
LSAGRIVRGCPAKIDEFSSLSGRFRSAQVLNLRLGTGMNF